MPKYEVFLRDWNVVGMFFDLSFPRGIINWDEVGWPNHYFLVAEVEAPDIRSVFKITQNIDNPWFANNEVIPVTGARQSRSVSVGDVIVEKDSNLAHLLTGNGFEKIFSWQPKNIGPLQVFPGPDHQIFFINDIGDIELGKVAPSRKKIRGGENLIKILTTQKGNEHRNEKTIIIHLSRCFDHYPEYSEL